MIAYKVMFSFEANYDRFLIANKFSELCENIIFYREHYILKMFRLWGERSFRVLRKLNPKLESSQ